MTLLPEIAEEAQKLSTDKLINLYILDLTSLGGEVYRFISSIDNTMEIDSLTYNFETSIATCVTTNPHTLESGDFVRVLNADQSGYNGDHTITVVDATTFTFNLFEAVNSDATGDYLKAIRLANTIKYDGEEYTPIAFEATGFEWNGQGSQPNPKIRVSNINRVMLAAVITANDGIGADFTRIRVFRKDLDDGTRRDPTLFFPKEVYRLNRKTVHNRIFIEWELSSSMDQQGVKIPGRQCLKRTCTHRYRVWNATTGTFDYTNATCPYVGTNYFDAQDRHTSNPASDACGKLLSSCSARFGSDPLPTRAMPGIGGV